MKKGDKSLNEVKSALVLMEYVDQEKNKICSCCKKV